MDRTVCLFDIHVRWQPSPSFGVQLQSAAAFQCNQDSEEKAVMTDYQWTVFCLLKPKTPHCHPLLLSLPPSSCLSCTISLSITGTQFTDTGTWFYYSYLWYLVLSYNHIYIRPMQLIHVLFDAHNMQFKNEKEHFNQINYEHEICYHHKWKGNVYISCACANACLPLFRGVEWL